MPDGGPPTPRNSSLYSTEAEENFMALPWKIPSGSEFERHSIAHHRRRDAIPHFTFPNRLVDIARKRVYVSPAQRAALVG
jgi:hypothetical protein